MRIRILVQELDSLVDADLDREKILQKADEILEIDPKNFDALSAKAFCLMMRKEYEKSLAICDEILERWSDQPLIYEFRALNLIKMGMPKEGQKNLRQAMQIRELPNFDSPNFIIEKALINLKIINVKTMALHHQWVWHCMNNSIFHRIDQLVFVYEGDAPRDFQSLNFRARDNFGNVLEFSPEIDFPQRKMIRIFLKEPIRPGQRSGPYFMEFDWDGPKRTEYWGTSQYLREFEFQIQVPKNCGISPKVFEVNEFLEELPTKNKVEMHSTDEHDLFSWQTKEPQKDVRYKMVW